MGDMVHKLNIWIETSLSPALSAYYNYMEGRPNHYDFTESDNKRALEDFNETYQLLLHAMTELRKVLKDPLNKFEENCKTYLLTEREKEITKLLALGKSTKKIADALFISDKTVQSHISNVFKKVNVNNRINLIAKLEYY